MNKTTRTSRATSDTYNSNFNADIPQWSGESCCEEEEIVVSKGSRKSNIENKIE